MKLFELNLTKLGDMMIMTPLTGAMLGHSSLEKTDRYLHPQTVEGEYVNDVLYGLVQGRMSMEEFAVKWFGSEEEMLDTVTRVWERRSPQTSHAE